ncbi:kinesin-like protein KIF12 isoform X2 [Cylas formicarius]|nr:kinesin-like protein KIF12 isoform X2 [Cylas formicarius]
MVDGIPGGPSGGQKEKLFSYNVVFEPAATQEDVLQFSGMKRLIEMAVEGFRCTCFCYGQTGSGKTHTLTGPPGLFGLKTAPYSDKHGLVFRSFMYLFQQIQNQPDKHFVLKASYLEIYNEKVIDLLNPGSARKPLAVRWSKKARGFFVENLFTVDCEELDDLIAVLEEGLRNRAVGKHNMNDYSSRSHTILSVYITSEQPAENGVFISRTGKVNFVDLAGSEMTKKTQSEGKTLEEANNINKSLMVLGYCISSLSDSKKRNHIPYRDSKLTKLLADSLAGNGVTLMIACISPAKFNINETINTLRYAARAKKIRTKPVVLMDPREALILSLKREVDMLQTENEQLRSALNVYSVSTPLHSARTIDERLAESTLHVNLDELAKLDGPQLAELVRLYVKENGDLRKENIELFSSRELLQRDHELVCRENERLLKRLDEFSASSPPVPTRSAFSAEVLNNSDSDITTNVWTNPDQIKSMSLDSSSKEMPEFIQKEMDKRRIGNNPTKDLNLGNRRPSSWEEKPNAPKIVRTRSSTSDGNSDKGKILRNPSIDKLKAPTSEKRRFSIAKPKDDGDNVSKCSEEVFGSVIVPSDEDDL